MLINNIKINVIYKEAKTAFEKQGFFYKQLSRQLLLLEVMAKAGIPPSQQEPGSCDPPEQLCKSHPELAKTT